jgi:HEPN domain-containing protein
MNRRKLQTLARDRLADARALLHTRRYAAAYYIAGYAVECALKARVTNRVNRHDFPDKKLAIESYTHDLEKLVEVAELEDGLEAARAADEMFERNWEIVCEWSAEDRYELDISRDDALKLYGAITARRVGVMTWIRSNW